MKRFRDLLFWCHLTTGVTVGLVVLVMSVTGVLLTYQRQITSWADLRALDGAPSAPDAARLPVATLVERARKAASATPTAITWRPGRDTPVEVAIGRERRLFLNAYTGAVLGEGSRPVRTFFRVVTDWHRWLSAGGERRAVGKAITNAANLGFLFLVTSGFYLWWPRTRTRSAVRNVALFRRGLAGKARDFNWHNVIGLWSAVPLFVVVLSGVVISYPWASALVFRLAGEKPPPQAAAPRPGGGARGEQPALALGGLDSLVPRAERRVPGWRTIALTLPTSDTARVAFTIDAGTGGEPQKRAQLAFDRATGEERRWEPFASQTPGRRVRSVLRFAHTGEVLGVVGQTIAGLVSLGAALLAWTGLALSLRRYRSWRARVARYGAGAS